VKEKEAGWGQHSCWRTGPHGDNGEESVFSMREMDSFIRVTHGIPGGFDRRETTDVIKPKNDRVVLAVEKLVWCAGEFSCGARLKMECAKGRTLNFERFRNVCARSSLTSVR
jgi:hypothetical protein